MIGKMMQGISENVGAGLDRIARVSILGGSCPMSCESCQCHFEFGRFPFRAKGPRQQPRGQQEQDENADTYRDDPSFQHNPP